MAAEAVLNFGAEQRVRSREITHLFRTDISSIIDRLQAAPGRRPGLLPPPPQRVQPLGRRRSLHTNQRVPPLGHEKAKEISEKVPVC